MSLHVTDRVRAAQICSLAHRLMRRVRTQTLRNVTWLVHPEDLCALLAQPSGGAFRYEPSNAPPTLFERHVVESDLLPANTVYLMARTYTSTAVHLVGVLNLHNDTIRFRIP